MKSRSLAVAALLITITACSPVRPVLTLVPGKAGTAADRPPHSLLTVALTPVLLRPLKKVFYDALIKYPVETLQLRSVRGGRVTRTLLSSLGTIEATFAPDGTVIAVTDYGCRAQVLRIDPATGQSKLIRVLAGTVQEMALSPDGRRMAYITDPRSPRERCSPTHQPRHPIQVLVNPGGLPIFPSTPPELAIVDLASGRTVRDLKAKAYGPVWSPDGTKIAVIGPSANQIEVFSAAHLNRLASHIVVPPRGCEYRGLGWTAPGVVAALGCNFENPRQSPSLDLVTLGRGIRSRQFGLPLCTSDTLISFFGPNTLIWAGLGFGNGKPCGVPRPGGYAIAVILVHGRSLSTVATIPRQSGDFSAAGWGENFYP